jgi:hypothetical protein
VGISSTRSNEATAVASDSAQSLKARPPAKSQGAMSQQGYGAHGNECYPQHMVQLVGYRSPQALAVAQAEAALRLRLKLTLDQAAE